MELDSNKQLRNDKKGKRGIKRLFNAFFFSLDGIKAAFKDEEGFRQVVFIGIITFIAGLYFGDGFTEKILLILPAFLCVIIELFNSAIENAIDHTSLEIHPLAKKAKDMGSAAQMLGLLFLVFVWAVYIADKLL